VPSGQDKQQREKRQGEGDMRVSLTDANVRPFLFLYQLGERVTLYDDQTQGSVGVIADGVFEGGKSHDITYRVKRDTDGTYYNAREMDIRRVE
jgi:hypothetical protein